MFTAKKKIQLIDYQNSYHYRQQRKKRWYKKLKLSFILLLIISLVLTLVTLAPFAQSEALHFKEKTQRDNSFIHGPQLLFSHSSQSTDENSNKNSRPFRLATFPIDVEANIEINGLVAYAEIKQTFINPYDTSLEGKYQFPLPENSAVKQLIINLGDKEIIGEIKEKNTAKKLYQQARKQGKKASLVTQHRPNLFTNTIANIPAQSTIVVTLKFIMPITFSNGKFNFRLPLALTPRYQPKPNSHHSDYVYKQSKENLYKQFDKQLPEPFKLSITDNLTKNSRPIAPSQSAINIQLFSGIPISNIFSDSHKIKSNPLNNEQNAYRITLNESALNESQMVADRDFTLSWQLLPSNHPQVSTFTQEVAGEYYTLLTFFPPQKKIKQIIARDIIFIIDTSGSMQGSSMKQAKSSLHLALLQLNKKDSFNVIAFDNDTKLLFPITQMASSENINNAQQFIEGLNADGGTEMYRPLSNALMMKKNRMQTKKAIRQIVFITDGAVANEFELMQLLKNAQGDFRLYTVGIGAAPNGYFMKKAAQFGRGSYIFIQKNHNILQKITHFMTKISQPAISNITLTVDNQVHKNVEIYPNRIPDLYFGEPLQITIKSLRPIMYMEISGETVSEPWYQQLIIDENVSSKGISTLWARRKIDSLLDTLITGANKEQVKSQVITTSLTHQILSPYTSFIAVEKTIEKIPFKKSDTLNVINPKILTKNNNNSTINKHQNLLVAIPKTSIGWKLQFMIGITLILFGLLFMKITDGITLANKQLIRVNGNEKHN